MEARNAKQLKLLDEAKVVLSLNKDCEVELLESVRNGIAVNEDLEKIDHLNNCTLEMFEKVNAPKLGAFYKWRFVADLTNKLVK